MLNSCTVRIVQILLSLFVGRLMQFRGLLDLRRLSVGLCKLPSRSLGADCHQVHYATAGALASNSSILALHPPQPVPARQLSPTCATVVHPASTAWATWP